VRAQIRGLGGVVGSGEQNSRAPEALEMPRPVVDQNISVDDVLVSAKHNPAGWNERKMRFQPLEFVREGAWDFHGRAGDEDVMVS